MDNFSEKITVLIVEVENEMKIEAEQERIAWLKALLIRLLAARDVVMRVKK